MDCHNALINASDSNDHDPSEPENSESIAEFIYKVNITASLPRDKQLIDGLASGHQRGLLPSIQSEIFFFISVQLQDAFSWHVSAIPKRADW